MTAAPPSPRRARLRQQTLDEIRGHGYAQIARGGPTALSINGIAKEMGLSGPALYRYFGSRDELLVTLVIESYEDLADALEAAGDGARRRAPAGRVHAVIGAFRDWALAQPHRYRLVFGSTYGSGELDPDRIIPAADRAMGVLLRALADISPDPAPPVTDAALRRQLTAWGSARTDDPGLLLLGLTAWTRTHGIISLEIEGTFTTMAVDPERLYRTEIDHLIAQRSLG